MIELRNFSIGFEDRKLLDNVSTIFPAVELTAIIGRNGTGKSTLLKAICGLIWHYTGVILINGENERNIDRKTLSSIISYVNTRRPRIANLKCKDIVALGRSPYTAWHGKLSAKDYEMVDQALELVGMTTFKDKDFNKLSDGESQKIMIARAIAQDTEIIILDEPTSFLDLPTRYELVSLLKKLAKAGKTILFSTHELDVALKLSDNIALIESCKLINLPVKDMKEFLTDNLHPFAGFL